MLGTSTRTSDVLINPTPSRSLGLSPLRWLREVGSPQFGVLSARAPPSPRCTALTAASCENHGAAPNFGTRVPGIFGGKQKTSRRYTARRWRHQDVRTLERSHRQAVPYLHCVRNESRLPVEPDGSSVPDQYDSDPTHPCIGCCQCAEVVCELCRESQGPLNALLRNAVRRNVMAPSRECRAAAAEKVVGTSKYDNSQDY